jgi:prephenate dehydrogenase (NADP+)
MDQLKQKLEIGIIGFGAMGRLYASTLAAAGWSVYVCDRPEKYDLLLETERNQDYTILKDGFAITRRCDFVMFSVEASMIDQVVRQYGPSLKLGAIVCGQTSVKYPEIAAFEKYCPKDVHIITCHSLHGPSISCKGQPLVVINHRSTQESFEHAMCIFKSLESTIVELTHEEHDKITAHTQAVTHLAFLSMGTAWKAAKTFPVLIYLIKWENNKYLGGIDNVKTLIALRIYGNKFHVYSGSFGFTVGLVLMNPFAYNQVHQYATSVSELFKMMIQKKEAEFRSRLYSVF